jgi:hypothetical protein
MQMTFFSNPSFFLSFFPHFLVVVVSLEQVKLFGKSFKQKGENPAKKN